MPYKTVSLKLLRPTGRKRAALDDAAERYSAAFEQLLRLLRACPQGSGKKAAYLKQMDRQVMAGLDRWNVQPFKDALKLDAAMALSAYTGRLKNGLPVHYPVSRVSQPELLKALWEQDLRRRDVDYLFQKLGRQRPVLFCRYAQNRDYSLLYDASTGRYYAKLYLWNLADAASWNRPPARNSSLVYLGAPGGLLKENSPHPRYLLLPLELGDWQIERLREIQKGQAVPKSGELLRRGEDYYLNVRLWYPAGPEKECSHYLGVGRGLTGELFYAVCDERGSLITSGAIKSAGVRGKNRLHKLSNRAVELADHYDCQILLANLGSRSDGLWVKEHAEEPVLLSAGDYRRVVEQIAYKAELHGLKKPVLVSAAGLFQRCPACGAFKRANRMTYDKFLCVRCGYSQQLELVGAFNLARMLVVYRRSKIPVFYRRADGEIQYHCQLLNLEFHCEDSPYAPQSFRAFLMEYLEHPPELDRTGRSILKKLRELPDPMEGVDCLERSD